MKENLILAKLSVNGIEEIENLIDRAKEAVSAGASGLVIAEKYEDDKIHEKGLHTIKSLCEQVNVPVYADILGKDKEDVKKYLYAGCAGIIIDEKEKKALEDAAKRFGNESVKDTECSNKHNTNISFADLKTGNDGLIPCIVQDSGDGTVLMLAYMNEESFNETIKTNKMTYYSRSRGKLWIKGEESGHFQHLVSLTTDCDNDTLLAKVIQEGVACHTGERSCFFNDIVGHNDYKNGFSNVLDEVYNIILDRKDHPKEGSYTNYLFDKGIDKILKKVGEEATEIIIAAKNPEAEEIIYEIADFLYHVSVLMALKGVSWDSIMSELKNR